MVSLVCGLTRKSCSTKFLKIYSLSMTSRFSSCIMFALVSSTPANGIDVWQVLYPLIRSPIGSASFRSLGGITLSFSILCLAVVFTSMESYKCDVGRLSFYMWSWVPSLTIAMLSGM